jgi:hypothetical protein
MFLFSIFDTHIFGAKIVFFIESKKQIMHYFTTVTHFFLSYRSVIDKNPEMLVKMDFPLHIVSAIVLPASFPRLNYRFQHHHGLHQVTL